MLLDSICLARAVLYPATVMDVVMLTTELPSGASLPSKPERSTLQGQKVHQEDRTDVFNRERMETALLEAKEIARAEMARRRRRLGELTPEQEIVIEDLLIRTVTRISELGERVQEYARCCREPAELDSY